MYYPVFKELHLLLALKLTFYVDRVTQTGNTPRAKNANQDLTDLSNYTYPNWEESILHSK